MSRFLRNDLENLAPYVPGEQPSDRKYIKLNTNESPFPPSPKAIAAAARAAENLRLYPPLDGGPLRKMLAEKFGLTEAEVAVTNGSDEALNFIFKAFCSLDSPAAFADITYGFYSVFAELNGVPYDIIPLKSDFSLNPTDYMGIHRNIFIANPNAPTGLAISLNDIEEIADSNPENIIVVDEAYVDFGSDSAVNILREHQNLIVVQTFSKSRSLAGARVGFMFAAPDIINDIYRIIYSTNPYNISMINMAAAMGALEDEEYTKANCLKIISTREKTENALKKLGFTVIPSKTNFIFASYDGIDGKVLYSELKNRGILVRHFDKDRISQFLRITIGTEKQMEQLINNLSNIIKCGG